MRTLTRHPTQLEDVTRWRDERKQQLANYLYEEIHAVESATTQLHSAWSEFDRIYSTIPRATARDVPYINASNRVSPQAAEKADDIYSQTLNAVTAINPIITVRATNANPEYIDAAKAIQRRTDLGVNSDAWNAMPALKEMLKDTIKKGTGILLTHWVDTIKKTKRLRITHRSSCINAIPIENVYVPAGSFSDVQQLRWIAVLHEYTFPELEERARRLDWDLTGVMTTRNPSRPRSTRESVAMQRQNSAPTNEKYSVFEIYCWFDMNDDSEEEALLVHYNYESNAILRVDYDPYDHRPFSVARFDMNEYLFFGKGVIEMLMHMNEMASDVLNSWYDNGFLANTRMWIGPPGSFDGEDTVTVWAGRKIDSTNPDQLKELILHDIYNSWPQLFELISQLMERRVGIPNVNRTLGALGSRTPGITALTALQNLSQRHAAAFDSIRHAFANAVRHCLYREQERLLLGDFALEQYLTTLLGEQDAALYIKTLTDENFDDAISVELTASSASINKADDRQNALLIGNYFRQYILDAVQLLQLASAPGLPMPLITAIEKMLTIYSELIERMFRTFEQIRDPENLAVDFAPELQQIAAQAQLQQLLASLLPALGLGQIPPGQVGASQQSLPGTQQGAQNQAAQNGATR